MANTNNSINSYYSNVENLCYAGDFSTNPWQQGTSIALTSQPTGQFLSLIDGFSWSNATTNGVTSAALTVSRTANPLSPTVTGTIYSPNCMGLTVTTGQPSLTTGNEVALRFSLEGYDFAKIYGRPVTLSFYVYSNVTGTYGVIFASPQFNSSGFPMNNYYVTSYNITSANTWQKVVITIPPVPFSNGGWNFTNGWGAQVMFCIACAPNLQTSTLNQWVDNTVTGALIYSATGQVNAVATAGNIFNINLIQIEQGSTANPFQIVPVAQTYLKCLRYYQKSFPQGTAPAQNAGLNGAAEFQINANSASTALSPPLQAVVPMRGTPTITFYNPSAANAQVRNVTAATNTTGTGIAPSISDRTMNASFTVNATGSNTYAVHYTSNATLP